MTMLAARRLATQNKKQKKHLTDRRMETLRPNTLGRTDVQRDTVTGHSLSHYFFPHSKWPEQLTSSPSKKALLRHERRIVITKRIPFQQSKYNRRAMLQCAPEELLSQACFIS